MNEKQLRALKLAVETGTIVQASRMMHVSQPAVSQMLTSLEQELGFSLFNRRQGRITPTPHGLYFLDAANTAIASLDSVRDVAQMLRTNPLGQIKVSTTPGMSLTVLPSVVAQFLDDFPECPVSIQARTSPRTVDLVAHEVVDIGIVDAPYYEKQQEHVLFQSPLRCIFREGHPLGQKDILTPADVVKFPLVTLNSEANSTQSLASKFDDCGQSLKPVTECNLFFSVISTALHANAVGFAPAQFGQSIAELPPLVWRPFIPEVSYECAVLATKTPELKAEKARFLELLIAELSRTLTQI